MQVRTGAGIDGEKRPGVGFRQRADDKGGVWMAGFDNAGGARIIEQGPQLVGIALGTGSSRLRLNRWRARPRP